MTQGSWGLSQLKLGIFQQFLGSLHVEWGGGAVGWSRGLFFYPKAPGLGLLLLLLVFHVLPSPGAPWSFLHDDIYQGVLLGICDQDDGDRGG